MQGKRQGERKTVAEGRYDGYRMHLRNQRIRCGITQKELAKQLNVARVTVTQWERGLREPDFETCVKIREILGIESIEKILETYKFQDGIFVGCCGGREIGIQ